MGGRVLCRSVSWPFPPALHGLAAHLLAVSTVTLWMYIMYSSIHLLSDTKDILVMSQFW